ncbi:MAG: hypothetical protein A2147_09280 [Chloroflexi bacterium RBG_16_57_8]|nr:MAG: hypothetical protein A2147_09280 [Chloroflexi bacterium RBG_16_57_8]
MTPNKKHVIIGCGPAALSALDTIRRLGSDDEITVVSREDSLPYSPAVLPYLLAGKADESDLFPRNGDYFSKRGVAFVRGQEAVRVLPDRRQVVYRNGETEQYDTLLIACGAESIAQPVHDSGEGELLNFHTFDDYRRLRDQIKDGCDVTVLGAGMVAVELAVALIERGCDVRIIGRGRPLRAYFDEEAGGHIRAILVDRGMKIITGKSISHVRRSHGGFGIACADGEVFETSVVVSCLGVRPNLSLVQGAGISANQGVLVDRHMRTNAEGVYAAGDVVEAPSFLNGSPGVCAVLPEAIAQGKVAGANIAGRETGYEGWIPMNLLKFFGHSAFSIGMAMPAPGCGEMLEKKDKQERCFERLVVRDGRLIGAMFVNVDIDPGVISYLIKRRVNVGAYGHALLEQPADVSRWLMLKAERNG